MNNKCFNIGSVVRYTHCSVVNGDGYQYKARYGNIIEHCYSPLIELCTYEPVIILYIRPIQGRIQTLRKGGCLNEKGCTVTKPLSQLPCSHGGGYTFLHETQNPAQLGYSVTQEIL